MFQSGHVFERNISSGSTDPVIMKQLLENEPITISKVSNMMMMPVLAAGVQNQFD